MKKSMQINVGLQNNIFNQNNIVSYFNELQGYDLLKYTFEVGQYKGRKEVTFVALLNYDYCSPAKVLLDFEKIASVMQQQCIAIKLQGLEALAYSIGTKNKSLIFDKNHFYSLVSEPTKKQRNLKMITK